VADKTDTPKKASGRSRATKKNARKAKKAATSADQPAVKKTRKRATKAVSQSHAISDENSGERRKSGGWITTPPKARTTPETPIPGGAQVLAAANDDGTPVAPDAAPDAAPGADSAEGQPEAAGRKPETGKRSKTTTPRSRAGESAGSGARPNTLVPTNGIHTTQRRIKRKFHQNRGVMGLAAATLLGIIILGEQTPPPDMTDFEQEIAASLATGTYTGSRVASTPPGIITPKPEYEPIAAPGPEASQITEHRNKALDDGELVEMERLLARLDMGPSGIDGVVDYQTEAAIRLYQEIAGLPVDGAPSRTLLADMREVVKIMEDGG